MNQQTTRWVLLRLVSLLNFTCTKKKHPDLVQNFDLEKKPWETNKNKRVQLSSGHNLLWGEYVGFWTGDKKIRQVNKVMNNYGWKYGSEPHPRSCAHGMSSAQHRRQRQPANREEGGAKIRKSEKNLLSIIPIQNVWKNYPTIKRYRKIGVQCWIYDKSFWFRNVCNDTSSKTTVRKIVGALPLSTELGSCIKNS